MDSNYFTDRYQFLPSMGYTSMITAILNSPSITVLTGKKINIRADSLTLKGSQVFVEDVAYDHIFYTGMIDELCSFALGDLPYRSLHFSWSEVQPSLSQRPSMVLNYPCNYDFTRVCDYSHIARALGDIPRA